MSVPSEQAILNAIAIVRDRDRGNRDLVSLGMISGLSIAADGVVNFAIEIAPADAARMEPLRAAAEAAVAGLPGVSRAVAVLTAKRAPAPPPRPAPAPTAQPTAAPAAPPSLLPDVTAIVAVASGKGGVGKSTTATNLAVALADMGLAVGLLDADIYGPSQPRLLGITSRPEPAPDGKMHPILACGLKVMSIGFIVPEDQPMVWRGPMVMSALRQLLGQVVWGTLDVMIVDMPPGTGDTQLTLAQSVPLAGAVIVSTPQDIALIDARRGIAMFERVAVPVLGVIENMSYFACPHCGERTDLFGHGGARAEAMKLGAPFLGEIPLDIRIRETSDAGTPIVLADPLSPHALAYRAIAAKLWAGLQGGRRAAPRIVYD